MLLPQVYKPNYATHVHTFLSSHSEDAIENLQTLLNAAFVFVEVLSVAEFCFVAFW